MASLCILLVLLCGIGQVPLAVQPLGITQDPRVLMAQIGQTVTLKCFCGEDSVTFFSWYQQSLGRKPEIISSRMRHNKEAAIYPSFKGRFEVESKETINHLTIADLLLSDSATYYCGILEFNSLEFGEGTFLYVTMPLSNIQGVVYQPALDPVRPGDSVQLSCEAHGEKCKGEQSLYWFRQTKGEPVIMYQNEGNCVDEAHNRKCTLTYSIKSVNSSDEGMYYCALASCGKLVFGNGTQVQLTKSKVELLVVYCLSSALAVSIILLFVLAFTSYTLKRQICSVCKGTVDHQSISAGSDITSHDAGNLHYAAVGLKTSSEGDLGEEEYQHVKSVCVYSTIKMAK
ncbi:uncharacterized protein [Takifugu rubripes]|uniref:Uncharacterized LOC105419708 n=2 Tax=Takifugu TaxID=31032 RepID=A0A3B5K9F0_TAKRU|nr:uncharacterized protein LOC105419708 [Takifugu rubripes]XP_056883888.1 uncharacterized protein LOC130522983 [Takifugu flavidus]TNM93510.1 hypothetical protein fugu_001686 [Takifugu bimaculatus]